MMIDVLLLALFLGLTVLLCWLAFRISFPRDDHRSGRSGRHHTHRNPKPHSDDESTRITPPA